MHPPSDRTRDEERRRQDERAGAKRTAHDRYAMRRLLREQADRMLALVPSDAYIVDLGCGVGDFLEHAARHGDHRALGIDLSPESVRLARERFAGNDRVDAIEASADTLSRVLADHAPPPQADAVFMRGVIHHLETPAAVFREVRRALRPGGRLVVLEGNVNSAYRRLALGVADLLGVEHEASQFPHTPVEDITRLLGECGFGEIEVRYVPALSAPLAYLGLGNQTFWTLANRLDRLGGRLAPRMVGWWYLLSATAE